VHIHKDMYETSWCYIADTPKVEKEKYYAVQFDQTFYIGRVLEVHDDDTVKVTYLHRVRGGCKDGAPRFTWPRRRDIEENLNIGFIFYGPIELIGNDPFTVDNINMIQGIYDTYHA
jgi:hypothetical protein